MTYDKDVKVRFVIFDENYKVLIKTVKTNK